MTSEFLRNETSLTKPEPFRYNSNDYVFDMSWAKFEKMERQLSRFDVLLQAKWNEAMAQGSFRYNLEHLQSRVVPGKQKFIVQLNCQRLRERRTPENIVSCHMPYDPEKFNFTKVKPEEILFRFEPERHRNTLANGRTEKGAITETQNSSHGMLDKDGHHLILINVSPLEYGHVLLVPEADSGIPQRLTLEGIRLAIDLLLLSAHPGLRIGFNSLCALASVNHQHIHAWYLEHSMAIESIPVKKISGALYELVDFPARGFAFQLHGTSVKVFAEMIYKVADYLQVNSIAHNFFITRGSVFNSPPDSCESTVRAYLWPRISVTGIKSSAIEETVPFNIAVAELAGHVPMYVPDVYEKLTEDYISEKLAQVMLPADELNAISDDLQRILCRQV